MEELNNTQVHAAIDKLQSVKGSEAYLYFQEILYLESEARLAQLLKDRGMRQEDEHDRLTELRTLDYLLNYMPGRERALREKLFNLQMKSEAVQRQRDQMRNEDRAKRLKQQFGLAQAELKK